MCQIEDRAENAIFKENWVFRTLLALSLVLLAVVQGCVGLTSAGPTSSSSSQVLTIDTPATMDITATSATIIWTTSIAASSQVDYGGTTSYGSQTTPDMGMATSHSQSLNGLQSGQLYHYRVASTDANKDSATSGDFTFTTSTAPDTTPPTVSISSPTFGASVSGTVSVTANASDSVGVASVQFQIDSVNVGSLLTTAPYSYSWNTTATSNGSHSLRAIAKDAAGNSTTSAAVSVIVNNADTTPPMVSITAPASGATVSGTLSVTASASDNVGVASAQFQLDSVNVGALLTAAPYSYSWNTTATSNGSHSLRAIAKDAAGNSTTSAAVSVTVNNADTTPPTVSITAPALGATVSGTLSVTASASDNVGVASAQFQLDSVNVGALLTTAPYSYSWNTTATSNGSHSLRAIAKDAAGNSTTSAAVSVTVNNADTTPPTVSISSPASGASVSGTVSVTANASDNVGVASVQFQIDSVNVGSLLTTAPYSYSWNTTATSNGSHSLRAIAKDAAGNSTTSAAVSVTVNNADTTPPTVSISSPASGASVSGTVSVTANASDNVGVASVQFQIDSVNVGSLLTTAPYSYSWNTTATSNGSHSLRAIAKDAAGNSTTSAAVSVTVNNADTTPPTVSISSPASGASVSGTISVTANASDNVGVASVQFQLDSVNVGALLTAAPYSYSWNTTATSNGSHSLRAIAKDAAGNSTTSAAVSVTVNNADTTPPTVSITAPASGASVSGTISVTANASDNVGVASVQFQLDSVNVGALLTAAPYSYSWNTTATSNGSHSLRAIAKDAAGNSTTSAAVSVTVNNADTTPPTVSISSPASGASVSGTVSVTANASDNVGVASVQFQIDSVNVGSLLTTAPYSYSWNTTATSNGSHSLRAIAKDAAGNSTTSAAVSVTVNNADTTPPTVSITAPASGASVSGTVFVTANATDNVGVASVQFQLDSVNVGALLTAAPYSYSWNTTATSNGSHSLRAIAKDAAGNSTTSAAVSVTVNNADTTPPTVSITAPASGASVSGTISVTANASDNVGVASVQFQLDSVNVGALLTAAPYSYSWNTTATSNGSHSLRAIAKDAAGNSTTSAAVSVTVNNADTTPPTVSITAPASGATVSGTLSVTASASDNVGVASVQFQLDSVNVGALLTAAPYSYSWNTTATSNGSHSLRAIAKDAAGNSTTSAAVSVTVNNADTTPPTVSISSPISGATVSGTLSVTANASDNVGVASVQFRVDGSNVGSPVTATPYTYSLNTTTLSNGAHTLTAVATDTSNNSTTSAGVSITVNNATQPTISTLSPNSGPVGTSVTIAGSNFGTTGTVTFNGTTATTTGWSATSIVVSVPSGATPGNVVVTVSGVVSNGVSFTVTNIPVVYPLKKSANARYFVDQNNVPVLMVGDTAHDMMGKATPANIATYLSDRQKNHFNVVNIYAPCGSYVTCSSSGAAQDGTLPFTSGTSPSNFDLSTPNNAFFTEVDSIINTAAADGITIMFDPIETGDFLTTLEANGTTKAFNYGVYLGNRYKSFPNIIWMHGEDFQSWSSNSSDNNLAAQVMAGIASVDTNHFQTIELNYYNSYSNQDSTVRPYLGGDYVYTYYETYAEVLNGYNSSPTMPVFLGEGNYETGNNNGYYSGPAGPEIVRRQVYWTLTSGAAGHVYGNEVVNHFASGWQNQLDTAPVNDVQYATNLFTAYNWWNLVPDQTHQIVTAGYGTANASNGNIPTANYATTAWITDGTLAIAYAPTTATLTVNMAKFANPVAASWYDPSNGTFQSLGAAFTNSGTHNFVTPGNDSDGNSDWVLVLDAR